MYSCMYGNAAIIASSDTEFLNHVLPKAIRYNYCQSVHHHSITRRAPVAELQIYATTAAGATDV
ncbi:hypothetical protein QU862_28055 [Escherichia coli]|nr:hypothetical protein [Escherichia coli]